MKKGWRGIGRALLGVLICCLVPLPAPGHPPCDSRTHSGSGMVKGSVRALDRTPLAETWVMLIGQGKGKTTRTEITDAEGQFRFVDVTPGIYAISVFCQGRYLPQSRQGLRVSAESLVAVDLFLSQAFETVTGLPDTGEVIDLDGSSPLVTEMTEEYLAFIPSARNLSGQLAHAAGLSSESAFGSSESLSSSFRVQGFSLDNPETGALAVNLDYDAVSSLRVSGPGLPAEIGGFSGSVVDVTTRAAQDRMSGMFTLFLQLPEWHNPNTSDPAIVQKRFEEAYGAHFSLGGALVFDRLRFFMAGRAGYWKEHIEEWPPEYSEWGNGWNLLGTLNWSLSAAHRLSAVLEWDRNLVNNVEAGPFSSPESVPSQWVNHGLIGLHWASRFSRSTRMDLRMGAYFQRGRLDLLSTDPPRLDLGTGVLSGNYLEYWEYPQERYSLSAVLSHRLDRALGVHTLKAGLEGEFSSLRDHRGIPGDRLYLDFEGEPYLQIAWGGYDRQPRTRRISCFVQDSWSLPGGRLFFDVGVRIRHVRGDLESFTGAAFAPRTGIAPRLGAVWDMGGNRKTLLRGHYGKYFHGMKAAYYMNMEREELYQEYYWDGQDWVLFFEDPWEDYFVDPDLRMPYMQQYVLSLERELFFGLTAEVAYIERIHHDLIDRVNLSGQWIDTQFTDPVTGETFPAFQRLNPGENQFLQTNPSADVDYGREWGAAFPGIVSFTPSRHYRGLAFSLDKRFSRGWQLHASYVYSRTWGSDDNIWGEYAETRTSGLGASTLFSNPNHQINAVGRLTIDPTHLLKVSGSYLIPGIEVVLGLFYTFASGETYNRNIWVPDDIDPDPVSDFQEYVTILGEERGAFRYPSRHNLDLRLEKFFSRSRYRLGILVDVFNALNSETPTWVQAEVNPWTEYGFGHVLGIRFPRSYRIGIRFSY